MVISAVEAANARMQNIIPTGQNAIQLVTTVTFAMLSDYLRNRPFVMSISTVGFYFMVGLWGVGLNADVLYD